MAIYNIMRGGSTVMVTTGNCKYAVCQAVCRVSAARHSADLGSLPSVGRPALGETAVTVTFAGRGSLFCRVRFGSLWTLCRVPEKRHSAKLSSPALALPSVSGTRQISVYLLLVKYWTLSFTKFSISSTMQWGNEAQDVLQYMIFLNFMFICKITQIFMHDVEVEINNCEKLLED